jgi:hypothetical protein
MRATQSVSKYRAAEKSPLTRGGAAMNMIKSTLKKDEEKDPLS